ncbi:MAG: phosphodiester glycosidase family protein [Acidaminobacteraceae bacterium]
MSRFSAFVFMMFAPIVVLMLLISPKVGAKELIKVMDEDHVIEIREIDTNVSVNKMDSSISDVRWRLSDITSEYDSINSSYLSIINMLNYSLEKAKTQVRVSSDIYENKILNILGKPIYYKESINNQLKIFKLEELGYRGFMVKIKLYNPKSFKVVLADGRVGGFETTSSMAKSSGALLAINGGGFGKFTSNGKIYTSMVGATVVDGKFKKKFVKNHEKINFVGINSIGEFIGITPNTNKEIENLNPYQGLSFIPSLIVASKKTVIPAAWKNTKHPRTIIGKYPNGDILLIVVDGRNNDWSKGITLERIQEKLLILGVEDAYNLDGGGSTTLYYDGKILNQPSDGGERNVANSFILMP